MLRLALYAAALLAVGTGCLNNARRVGLTEATSMTAEDHRLWTRPTEVGYEMGGEIAGTATSRKILFIFNIGESKPPTTDVLAVVGGGGGAGLGSVGSFAAYKAVSEAQVEGIYVTRLESDSTTGFLGLWSSTTVTLYGRALKLKSYGPISEDRADQWRFRNNMPNVVVVKEGSADVMLPLKVTPGR